MVILLGGILIKASRDVKQKPNGYIYCSRVERIIRLYDNTHVLSLHIAEVLPRIRQAVYGF